MFRKAKQFSFPSLLCAREDASLSHTKLNVLPNIELFERGICMATSH
jgi:hypothetical protein